MKHKKTIIIGVILLAVSLIIFSLANSTYALFSSDVYGVNTEAYTTGMLLIEAANKSDTISLTNSIPMTDDNGSISEPYIFTIKNIGNLDYEFDVILSGVNSSNIFDPQYIKLKVDDGSVTTLDDSGGTIKSNIVLKAGESIDISIRVWLSIDTPNTQLGKTFSSKLVIDGQAVYTSTNDMYIEPTPYTDFQYYLGSEISVVDTVSYYDVDTDTDYDISVSPYNLESNEILLVKYNGTDKEVNVPNVYRIGDVTYNVTLASYIYVYYYDENTDYEIESDDGVFAYNENIESVILGNNIEVISLYDEVSENNANNLFSYCTSLVNVPVIPSSVTGMSSTFWRCTSLVNAPVIPNSVTYMDDTFSGCTNLTGTVRINSSNVNFMSNIFNGTTKDIIVEVPTGSTTYNNLTSNKPSNVTISPF